MDRYKQEFTIMVRDVTSMGYLTCHALVDFMQDTARNHATKLGLEGEESFYCIILRTKVDLKRVPMIGERISVETRIEGIDKIYLVRRFEVTDQLGENIGSIIGYYALMSSETHTPIKLRSFKQFEGFDLSGEVSEKLSTMKVELIKEEKVMKRCVYSSMIDVNRHMNNAYYIGWIADMYCADELERANIQSLQIQYKKEVKEDAEVNVVRGVDQEGRACVIGRAEDGTIHFISVLKFDKE